MSIDIEREVVKIIENKNKGKEDKIEISSDLNRAIVYLEEVIKEFERHYSLKERELERELDKIGIDSHSIKSYIQREIQDIIR